MLTDNHFQVFGLTEGFEVDQALLAERYRDLQRGVHPDNFADAPAQERRLALQKAAQINEAFQTLKNPLSRGRYLLELRGAPLNDQEPHALDGAFLMEQMELREALADIKTQAEPVAALNAFLQDVERRIDALVETLSVQFKRDDLRGAQDSVRKLQFFRRLREEALALEEELL